MSENTKQSENPVGVDITALKTFAVSFDGLTSSAILAGEKGRVPDDAVKGLIEGGYVKAIGKGEK